MFAPRKRNKLINTTLFTSINVFTSTMYICWTLCRFVYKWVTFENQLQHELISKCKLFTMQTCQHAKIQTTPKQQSQIEYIM